MPSRIHPCTIPLLMPNRILNTPLPGDTEESQVRMGFGEHLEDLRKRIFYALFGSIGFIAVAIYYMHEIMAAILRPYQLALKAHGYTKYLGYAKPPDVVIIYFSVAIKVGLVVASPWIIYQIWLFIAAGLYQRERRLVYKYIGPSAMLFLLGVSFFYFLVLPLTLNFFIGFNDSTAVSTPHATWIERKLGLDPTPPGMEPSTQPATQKAVFPTIPVVTTDPDKPPAGKGYLYFDIPDGELRFRAGDETWTLLVAKQGALFVNLPQVDDYLDFVQFTGLIFGLAFEMPMVILILAQINFVTPATFRKIRKYAYFVIAILSAIGTPRRMCSPCCV